MKICALMVPKEMKLEHSGGVIKAMTDEELDEALVALRDLLARREAAANVIEGSAEPVALPAPARTDEQLDATLDALREITRGARQRGGENVIKGTAEPVAPATQSPEATPEPTRKPKSNRLMREADTAVGPRERKPRMRKGRSTAST